MITLEEAIAILTKSKQQNEIMRDNPHTFFSEKDLVTGPQKAQKSVDALTLAIVALHEKERMRARISRVAEQEYMMAFARENCFDSEVCCDQLRSLWTAYCLHHNLDPDTAQYDNAAYNLWEAVEATEPNNAFYSNFDSFDNFMCKELV